MRKRNDSPLFDSGNHWITQARVYDIRRNAACDLAAYQDLFFEMHTERHIGNKRCVMVVNRRNQETATVRRDLHVACRNDRNAFNIETSGYRFSYRRASRILTVVLSMHAVERQRFLRN